MARGNLSTVDVVIVGGGLTGLTQALAMAQAGLAVAVLDRETPSTQSQDAFDGRVTSLAYGSHSMLDRLDVWPALKDEAEPILDIRVSDEGTPFFLHFDHRDVGDRPFGFMVENRFLRRALHEVVAASPVQWLAPVEVAAVERMPGRAEVRLADGRNLRAALVVSAEGRGSSLRQEAGIRCLSWQYGQTAIVVTVTHELPHHGVAKEHFLPAGPFALLPMTQNRSALVWTEEESLAQTMLALSDEAFNDEIQARAGDYWGAIAAVGPRWSYPLGLQNAERYIDRRLVLIGDAAHAMHPIAGQGLNLGLRDAAALAEVVVEAARLGLDIGDATVLRRYQEWRRFDALTMLVMTDGLNRAFSNRSGLLRLGRGLGLGVINAWPQARQFFERHAAALSGDLPRLIRGAAL